jgi:hypothetical protein
MWTYEGEDSGQYGSIDECDYVTGTSFLIKKGVIQKISFIGPSSSLKWKMLTTAPELDEQVSKLFMCLVQKCGIREEPPMRHFLTTLRL